MEMEQLMSLLVVGALLGAIGRGVTGMMFPDGTGDDAKKKWSRHQKMFFYTMWLHPILVGGLLGVPDWLPAPTFLGVGDKIRAGRICWYALAGAFSSTAFYRMDRKIKGEESES